MPDHISAPDLAALKPSGEVDGTIPSHLSVTLTPNNGRVVDASRDAAAIPSVPTAIDLTGRVASSFPGTPINNWYDLTQALPNQ